MDLEQYDEFGNYIGPPLEESSDESEAEEAVSAQPAEAVASGEDCLGETQFSSERGMVMRGLDPMGEEMALTPAVDQPVPHELKKFYPTAQEVYPDAETLIEEEDEQPITVPIIAGFKASGFDILEKQLPATTFSFEYLAALSQTPACVRSLCLLGPLHSGKTSFCDVLIDETHPYRTPPNLSLLAGGGTPHSNKLKRNFLTRYTDTRRDEQERGLSLKATPLSLVLRSSRYARRRLLLPINPSAAAASSLREAKQKVEEKDGKSEEAVGPEEDAIAGDAAERSSSFLKFSGSRSYVFHILDTPGHVNFTDESTAAIRLCDGVLFFIDALEGLHAKAGAQLTQVLEEGLGLVVVINKLDRLILELRLRPADAYFKLKCILEELNQTLEGICSVRGLPPVVVSPHNRNLLFAMTQFGAVFSVSSFAAMYFDVQRRKAGRKEETESREAESATLDASQDESDRARPKSASSKNKSDSRSQGPALFGGIDVRELQINEELRRQLGASEKELDKLAKDKAEAKDPKEKDDEHNGLTAKALAQMQKDSLYVQQELFELALWGDFYRDPETNTITTKPPHPEAPRLFVEFIFEPLWKLVAHCVAEERPTLEPTLAEVRKAKRLPDISLRKEEIRAFKGRARTTSPREGSVARAMKACSANEGPLMVMCSKSFHRPNDYAAFDVLGRVMSGTIFRKQKLRVLGEAFSLDDDEDQLVREVTHLWIPEGRYRVEVNSVPAGSWVLMGGIDLSVKKTATVTSLEHSEEVEIFRPLDFHTTPVVKIACEPLQPSELPKMIEGLRRIDKAYPIAETKVEESGEHVICGTGELYLDALLHDLRELYGNIEVKVSDPVVRFCETVVEASALKCFAETPNKKNKLFMVAEPLDPQIVSHLEKGLISDTWGERELGEHFSSQYGWDVLAARSIWAFGPSAKGGCVLLGEVFNAEFQKIVTQQRGALMPFKESVVQGFQWATREGPLIEEAVRGVRFKLLDAELAKEQVHRGGGQIIPTTRRVAYSAMLLASPRLLEPICFSEIHCPADCVSAIYTVLARRRGNVARDLPKPGTPLYVVHAYLPAIESFGFETDLRTHTSGQAFCYTSFDSWAVVPGDPLDRSIVFKPLEPAPAPHLAREFLLKTRKRKGLSEDVSIHKFFDDPMLLSIANNLQQFL